MASRAERRGFALAAALIAALLLAACGGAETPTESGSSFAAEAGHIHGLGIDPDDGALMIATHGGLFRAGTEGSPRRVGPVQDLMGFTVAGPALLLASGHPAPGTVGPDHLGLIESRDGGSSWRQVSLGGRADFHALDYGGGRIYGYNGLTGLLMVSADDGELWQAQETPAPVIDIAIDPSDPDRLVASTQAGLFEHRGDGGWRNLGARIGLLAWAEDGTLHLVEADGSVSASEDAGSTWVRRGSVGQTPAAFAAGPGALYLAVEDGSVLTSADDGDTWSVAVRP
jgi:hypothetical protein